MGKIFASIQGDSMINAKVISSILINMAANNFYTEEPYFIYRGVYNGPV